MSRCPGCGIRRSKTNAPRCPGCGLLQEPLPKPVPPAEDPLAPAYRRNLRLFVLMLTGAAILFAAPREHFGWLIALWSGAFLVYFIHTLRLVILGNVAFWRRWRARRDDR